MKNINILNNLNSGKTSSYFTINGTKEFTCENNGYVDNVVIEGETLVNLIRTNSSVEVWDNSKVAINLQVCDYLEGTYTLFNFSDKAIVLDIGEATTNNWLRTFALEKNKVKTFNIHNGERIFNVNGLFTDGWENNDTSKNEFRNSIVLLEGDHTDKPISYFEGLKSVGQGDKIEVLSYSKNLDERLDLSNLTWKDGYYVHIGTGAEIVSESHCYTTNYIPIQKTGCNMVFINANPHIVFYDENKNVIYQELGYFPFDDLAIVDVPINAKFLRFTGRKSKKNSVSVYYSQYDKKQISTTLRSLPNGVKDTIEKRGNKYIKVQRCGEVTFNGSEDWGIVANFDNVIRFNSALENLSFKASEPQCISDLFKGDINTQWNLNYEAVDQDEHHINIRILKTKLTTQDSEGFKTWLKSNPVTVVYELATPIITELPNFNPQTYKGDNALLINGGVIQCEVNFTVNEGIRSELNEVKDKVSNLTESVKNSLGSEISNEINTIKNTVNNNTNNIGNLTTKVNNGQNYKLTRDDGAPKAVDGGTFDDIKTTGIYTCTSNVGGAKPIPNYGGYYHLEVINADNNDDKWITQRATIFEGTGHGIQVYTRICQYGTWTHWGRNIVDGQATKMTEDNGACRGIPNNNANDIDITGFWMGANVSNAPTGTYGWVYIESKVHNSLFQVQIATDLHNSERRWIRHKVDGGWSEWRSL